MRPARAARRAAHQHLHMIADLRPLVVRQRRVNLRSRRSLTGQDLLMDGRHAGGDLRDLIGGARLDRGVQLRRQRVHLFVQT